MDLSGNFYFRLGADATQNKTCLVQLLSPSSPFHVYLIMTRSDRFRRQIKMFLIAYCQKGREIQKAAYVKIIYYTGI